QIPNRFDAIFVGVRRAYLRKVSSRGFEVMVVALQTRLLEAVGNFLALDNSQRRVRAGLAASGQVLDAIADFVKRRAFGQSFPGGDQSERGDTVGAGFVRGSMDRFGVDEVVAWRIGLVSGRLGAEAAILRTTPGLHVHDGAEMNLIPFEMFADTIGPGHQIKNVRRAFQTEKPFAFFARNPPA